MGCSQLKKYIRGDSLLSFKYAKNKRQKLYPLSKRTGFSCKDCQDTYLCKRTISNPVYVKRNSQSAKILIPPQEKQINTFADFCNVSFLQDTNRKIKIWSNFKWKVIACLVINVETQTPNCLQFVLTTVQKSQYFQWKSCLQPLSSQKRTNK